MKTKLIIATILTLIAGIGIFVIFFIIDSQLYKKGDGPYTCTAEAKICPDGTAVDRVGPKCEFAECPKALSNENKEKVILNIKIGQSADALGLGVKPIRVIEDSRCPIDVTCIQAGKVRLEVELTSELGVNKNTFEVGKNVTTEAEIVTLVQVLPEANSKLQIKPDNYQFTFEVSKRKNQ